MTFVLRSNKIKMNSKRQPSTYIPSLLPSILIAMPPPLHIEPSSLTPTYTFTVPAAQRKHAPALGCPLCTILTTLEDGQPIPRPDQGDGRLGREDQPFSPALPSPAVVQTLLPNPRSAAATAVGGRVLLVDDDGLTAWVASKEEKLAEEGRHVVLAFKRHVEDVYAFVRSLRYCILGHSFINHIHSFPRPTTNSIPNPNLSSLGPARYPPPLTRPSNSPRTPRPRAE